MQKIIPNKAPERVEKMRAEWATSDAKRDTGLVEPSDVKQFKSISYGEYEKWNLLDVYRPLNVDGKLPVIVSIHGGGYFYGDKELYRFYCMHLAQKGFAVVNFNYRLSPEFRYPSALEDATKVLNWIVENSNEYGLDYNNIFITGDSAGAQLTSHMAAIYSSKEYAQMYDFKISEKIKIRAVGLACGLYDVRKRFNNEHDKQIFMDYLGDEKKITDPDLDVLKYIGESYPPAFVFSSYCDFLYSECEPMQQLLASRGVEAVCKIYGTKEAKEIGHVFHVDMNLAEGEKANLDQISFFNAHRV